MPYATETTVSAEKSRLEIERTLMKFGARAFGYGTADNRAWVMFELPIDPESKAPHYRRIRFILALPVPDDKQFAYGPGGRYRSPVQRKAAYEQQVRSLWRALFLSIKAKLVAVEAGIATLEEEFLAHVMLPDGGTVGDWLAPQLARTYDAGVMPPLLPAPRDDCK